MNNLLKYGRLRGGQYKLLSRGDIHSVHSASLEVLEKVGMTIYNEHALKLLDKAGATVDYEKKRVWVPPNLVQEAVKKAPRSVKLCARKPEYDIRLEDRLVYFGTGGSTPYVLDLETGKKREAILEDIKNLALLTNSLENVHFFHIPVYPQDVPGKVTGIYRFHEALTYCVKPVYGSVLSVKEVDGVIKMGENLAGSAEALRKRPLIGMITCVTAPLMWDETYVQILLKTAEKGVPVIISSEPLAGGTGPATLAGSLVQQNAEALSGVVLTQLVNPGTPVIYGTVATILDPKLGSYVAGAVEMGLLNVAGAQMAQFYQLPIYATGGMTDSKIPDIQAGYEKAIISLMTGLAGANLVHDAAGVIESAVTYSYEQMIIDDEILGMVLRAVRGIEVNDDTLAVDVIKSVCPDGHFLSQRHTLKHVKTEYFLPKLSDRTKREAWKDKGMKDAWQRSREMAKAILSSIKPEPLPEDIKKEFDHVFEEEVNKVLKS